jgi:hypothetical protein
MRKKKAKPATKSTAKKAEGKSKAKNSDAANENVEKAKDVNPVEVRRDITNIVGNAAGEITRAVVVQAKLGQLATAKYLFEAAGFYPAPTESEDADKPEDDTLTKRIVRRLGLPEGPLPSSEDDDPPVKLVPLTNGIAPKEKQDCEGQTTPVAGSGNAGDVEVKIVEVKGVEVKSNDPVAAEGAPCLPDAEQKNINTEDTGAH